MQPEERYAHLKEIARTFPDFGSLATTPLHNPAIAEWLGRLHTLVADGGGAAEAAILMVAGDGLCSALHDRNVVKITNTLHRALARAEQATPLQARGAFLAPGNAHDALTAISSIIEIAERRVVMIDPYMNDKVLSHFALFASEGVEIALLAAVGRAKPTLLPAARAWRTQYGATRPVDYRLAPAGQLHDRLIIVDDSTVWDVSQSFADLAARSPATLAKSANDLAAMKVEAYGATFEASEVQTLE
ncbi:MAG TPA: hypothetical protein VF463_07735 [Sphingobium sp.]